MRILLSVIIGLLISFCGHSQIVNIPDANFKDALVNYPVADLGNGIFEDADTNNDGEIQVTEAESVVRLNVNNYEISSLIGIEYFINIFELDCSNNLLTNLDVSQNINLGFFWCFYNELSSLDVSMLPNLINFHCWMNNISELDLSQNLNLSTLNCGFNNLTQLDVSNNTNLASLSCVANEIQILDVSQNTKLYFLFCSGTEIEELDLTQNEFLVELQSRSNDNLAYLDLRNGNNTEFTRMWADETPNLDCILVDDAAYANNQECGYPSSGWCIDENDLYIEDINDCVLGIEYFDNSLLSIYPNPVKDIITIENASNVEVESVKIYDVLGRLVLVEKEGIEQIDVSSLKSGVFFLKIETARGVITKKLIKE